MKISAKKIVNSYAFKGSAWWMLGKIVQFLLLLGTMWAFSHYLSKEEYGIYKYVITMFSLLSLWTLPGMDIALVREVTRGNEGFFKICLREKIKWGIVGSFCCFIISFWYFLRNNSLLGILFLIAGVFLPLTNAFQIFSSFWQGKKRFDLQSFYSTTTIALSSFFTILAIILTKNLLIILLSQFTAGVLFKYFFYKKTTAKIQKKKADSLSIKFGKHLSFLEIFSLLSRQIDKLIIWQFLGAKSLAIYAFAQMPIVKILEFNPIFSVALPKLSEKTKIKKQLILKRFRYLFLVSVPLTIFCIFALPYFYKFFFAQYQESIPYAQALSLSLLFLPFVFLGTFFFAKAKINKLYFLQIVPLSIKIVLLFVLTLFYKLWGVIISLLVVQLISSIFTFYLFYKEKDTTQ